MMSVLYAGATIIIEQSATHGYIHYLDKGIVRSHLLEWNELVDAYKDAIENDTRGHYFDDDFKKIIESE